MIVNTGMAPLFWYIYRPGRVAAGSEDGGFNVALYPDNTSYYFYALGDDGVHHFFRTYREHINFINSQDLYN